MRKDSIELVANYLFTGGDGKKSLSEDEKQLLERIELCYTVWIDKPMKSDIEMRNFIMNKFHVTRQVALKILNYTIYALGNVNTASKSFVKHKINHILTKSAKAAEIGDIKLSQALTKIALAYAKAFNTGEDDIDMSEIRNNFTVKKVVIVNDPSSLGVKTTGREREETKRMLEKYGVPEDEVLDIEYEELNGNQ